MARTLWELPGGVGDQEHSAGTVEVAGRTAADLPARNDVKTRT